MRAYLYVYAKASNVYICKGIQIYLNIYNFFNDLCYDVVRD